jgi:Fe-S-cluster containining protein
MLQNEVVGVDIKEIFEKLKKWFLLKALRKRYIRMGKCKGCGRCCQEIYVRHESNFIQDEETFNRLKCFHPFYSYLKVYGKTETGLVFECTKLDKTTNKCKIYWFRPMICKMYPLEEIFMLGGVISDDCGFRFKPIEKFEDVLNTMSQKVSFKL